MVGDRTVSSHKGDLHHFLGATNATTIEVTKPNQATL